MSGATYARGPGWGSSTDVEEDGGAVHAALASPTRRKILDLMRDDPHQATTPSHPRVFDAHELARATGLHVTTVRFHLDVLRRAGLVASHPQERHTSGRPRLGFALMPADDRPSVRDGYRLLAGLLAGALAESAAERADRSQRLGRDWAADIVGTETSAPSSPASAALVSQVFTDLGFAPSHNRVAGYDVFELRACPFADVAEDHPEVVCGLHRGLMRGLVDVTEDSHRPTGVQAMVEPGLCVGFIGS